MTHPPATVIVRTKDSAATLPRVLSLVRAQTIPSEIIIVDSGSSDDTLHIARAHADQILEIPAPLFSFGRALNVGAAAAHAPIHFALSSHAFPPDTRWIERSLDKYERPDVAGTSGAPTEPHSTARLQRTHYQTLDDAIRNPFWGFSNTASSWRATVWRDMHFDETLATCEDKEWGLRALAAGWTIAVDPRLMVGDAHRRAHGLPHLYRRTRHETEVIASFAPMGPTTLGWFLRKWLIEVPAYTPYRRLRQRLSPPRFTDLLAQLHGRRASASSISDGASAARPPIDQSETGRSGQTTDSGA